MNMTSRPLLAVLLCFLVQPVSAESRLVPFEVSVPPVSEVSIQVLVTNEGSSPLALDLPKQVSGRLHGGSDRAEELVLDRQESSVAPSLAPGCFVRVSYTFRLPSGLLGPVVLDVPSVSSQPVMFSVQAERPASLASARSTSASAAVTEPQTSGSGQDPQARSSGEREAALRRATRVLPGISAYEPVYFGLGMSGGLSAKFQFSLKYNPLDALPLYMGFTQTSIWDLHGASKPFKDSAYRPALFYMKDKFWEPLDSPFKLGLQAGFEHESNGRGGLDSRSINIAFVRPRLRWKVGEHLSLVLSPKAYVYLENSENRDLADYRGYVDLYAAVLYGDWKLSTTLRKGTKGNYGSVQVDAVVPLRVTDKLFEKVGVYGVNGYWFLQYFNGWGESIIDYKTKGPAQFRAGIMVVP